MSNKAIAIFILVGLVLVIAVMIWVARPQSRDQLRVDYDAENEDPWTKSLETGAAWIGGLFGKGPSEFAMSRLRESDGARAVPGCRGETCTYDLTGNRRLTVGRDEDAPYAKLVVRPVGKSVTILFEPRDVEEDAEQETVTAGDPYEMTLLDKGGTLTIGCPQSETCTIEFSQGS